MRQVVFYNLGETWDTAYVEGCGAIVIRLPEDGLMVENGSCTREAQCLAKRWCHRAASGITPCKPEDDWPPASVAAADAVKRAAYRIHVAGGCDAADSYGEGYDDAITLALDIIMEETGLGISEILEYGERHNSG